MKNKIIFLLLLFLFTCSGLKAEDGVSLFYKSDIMKSAQYVTKERFEDANYVILEKKEDIEYKIDGSYTRNLEMYIKVLDEVGRAANVRAGYSYDKNYGSAYMDFLEVIDRNGEKRKINIDENKKEEIATDGVSSNIFDDSGVDVTVQIPDLEVGEIVHYKISENVKKARIEGEFSYFAVSEYSQPLLYYLAEITAPKEKPLLKNVVLGGKPSLYKLTDKEQENKIVYTFEAENIGQLYTEPAMPQYLNVAMRWITSTVSDWEAVSKWYYNLCEPRIIINEKIKNKTAELVSGEKDEKAKIMSIYFFVSRKVRYSGITLEDNRPGLEPHNSDYTFDTLTGVCRDKAALIVAMLRSAGFESYMVLVNATRKLDKEAPMTYFNHAIAGVVLSNGEIMLLDPTDETTNDPLPQYLMDKSYLLAKKSGDNLRATDILDGKTNMMKVRTDAKIEGSLIVCKSRLEFYGINDNRYRGSFAEMNKQEIENFLKGIVKVLSQNSKLISYKVTPEDFLNSGENLVIEIEYSLNDMLAGDKYKIIDFPRLSRRVGMFNQIFSGATLKTRTYPYVVRYTAAIDEEVEIELPENFKIESIPEDVVINGKSYYYNLSYSKMNNKIIYKNSASFNALELSVSDYIQFKTDMRIIENGMKKKIIVSSKSNKWRLKI